VNIAIGQRVRTLINLESADWHPEQPDIPAGSLGTVDRISYAPDNQTVVLGYGVMLDASVDRLSAWMDPDTIEPATEEVSTSGTDLAQRLADTAAGTWGEEAAIWLLDMHDHWIPELERCGYIAKVNAGRNTIIRFRAIDTERTELIGTRSEWQVLRVAADLAGTPIDDWFAQHLTALDERNRRLVLHAVAWAAGGRDYADQLGLLNR